MANIYTNNSSYYLASIEFLQRKENMSSNRETEKKKITIFIFENCVRLSTKKKTTNKNNNNNWNVDCAWRNLIELRKRQ